MFLVPSIARKMHPPITQEGECILWTINLWDTSPLLFQFGKFNRILIRKTKKIKLVIYTIQTFWICNLEPWEAKENIKKLNQTALMNRQKEAKSVKRWKKVKTQVPLLLRWPRRMRKSSKPLKWICQS